MLKLFSMQHIYLAIYKPLSFSTEKQLENALSSCSCDHIIKNAKWNKSDTIFKMFLNDNFEPIGQLVTNYDKYDVIIEYDKNKSNEAPVFLVKNKETLETTTYNFYDFKRMNSILDFCELSDLDI